VNGSLRDLHAMQRCEADHEDVQKVHIWVESLDNTWSGTTFCKEPKDLLPEETPEDCTVPHTPIPDGWDSLADFLEHGSTCGKCCYVLVGELGLPEDDPLGYLRGDLEAWNDA